MKGETIILADDFYIGKGTHKKVYLHPSNPLLCIKILLEEKDIDLERELKYRKVLEKKGGISTIIPKYYGISITSMGTGYVFERICDYDGRTSISLREFLKTKSQEDSNSKLVKDILYKFKIIYMRENVITSDIDPGNILVQEVSPEQYLLRIIDNIGSPVLIPLEYYFNYFAITKTNRYWHRLLKWIQRENPELITDTLVKELW